MATRTEKQNKIKIFCPKCKGNGCYRVPYHEAMEEVHAQCGVCDSEGEIYPDEIDDIIIDADGIHRLQ